jgi:hypothetical protein
MHITLGYLTHNAQAREENKLSLLDILMTTDMDRLRDLFHSFFASIPHDWCRKNQIAKMKIVSHAKAVGATGHVHTFKRRFL